MTRRRTGPRTTGRTTAASSGIAAAPSPSGHCGRSGSWRWRCCWWAAGLPARRTAAWTSDLALPLAGAAAAVLLLVALLTARAGRARAGSRSKLAAASTVADAVVVLGVVALAGLPPRSFALVLLMLPFLEAALWFGLSGLAGLWTMSSVALGRLRGGLPRERRRRRPERAGRRDADAAPGDHARGDARRAPGRPGRASWARRARPPTTAPSCWATSRPSRPTSSRWTGTAVLAQLVAGAEQLGATEGRPSPTTADDRAGRARGDHRGRRGVGVPQPGAGGARG